MQTRVLQDPSRGVVASILTDLFDSDVDAMRQSKDLFAQVLQKATSEIATAIAADLTPRIKDYIIAKIDLDQLIHETAKARVSELLFGGK